MSDTERLNEIREWVRSVRAYLDKLGPHITCEGDGYIPVDYFEELEELI